MSPADRRVCGDPLPRIPAVRARRATDSHSDVGIILLAMGLARFGKLIEYIPISVVLGFTSGIAITIATMQVKDFLV